MSNLTEYIEKIKQKTEGYTDLEKIRYVYIDLGKKMNFDLKFAFGNSKTKQKIYYRRKTDEELNESFQEKIITCKSISYIFEHIVKELGINEIKTVSESLYDKKCPHVYNVLTVNGEEYVFDLQEDMRNIKTNSRTKFFGISLNSENKLISRFDLEQIDKKIGYIGNGKFYTDDYIELLKLHADMFTNFNEKVQFVFENLSYYKDKNLGYADRRWRIEDIIGNERNSGMIFSKEEKSKIHIIDYCKNDKQKGKIYEMCIAVDSKDGPDIYMYSEEDGIFEKRGLEDLADKVQEGFQTLQGVQGLKKVLNKRKKDNVR